MATVFLTQDIRKEILNSIKEFENLIQKEIVISWDLRKHDKIILYTNKIIELKQALTDGFI